MFSLDENEIALFAEYEGQDHITSLNYLGKDFPSPGYSMYILSYDALHNDFKFGTFKQTHSEVYDYLEFINDDGEVFNLQIFLMRVIFLILVCRF